MKQHFNRPKVFISSTIYDFSDMRSALKFWLEELGYDVNASEFNDFQKDLNTNSYEACLRAIEESDYFVLLIGSRAGGLYDESTKTTITMQEYRHAYALAQAGKLKLAIFVRQSIWDVREDRKALARVIKTDYAKEHSLNDEQISKIVFHDSRVLTDAEVIFGFVSEVSRSIDMKSAVSAGGMPPIANWVHRFVSFQDIVEALRSEFAGVYGLRRVALSANLRDELISNLRHLLSRNSKGKAQPLYRWANVARSQFSGPVEGASSIVGKHLSWLAVFAIAANARDLLRSQALDEAIISGEFLEFSRERNQYFAGDLQQGLVKLQYEMKRLSSGEVASKFEDRSKLAVRFRSYSGMDEPVQVNNMQLMGVMNLHDRHYNIVALSKAIILALEEGGFSCSELYEVSPFDDQSELIKKETPSTEEVSVWLHS